jgi:hypothetical protein
MLGRFSEMLFGSEPAEFESSYPLEESVQRLDAARGSMLAALKKQVATGTVSESRVVLKRVVPFVRNSFKPYFVGHFEQRMGKVILVGTFTMHWSVKVFMTFWLGFCALWTILAAPATFNVPQQRLFPLIGVGMLAAGVAFLRICRWFSRSDPAWLSSHIRETLSSNLAQSKSPLSNTDR